MDGTVSKFSSISPTWAGGLGKCKQPQRLKASTYQEPDGKTVATPTIIVASLGHC